MGSSSSSFHIRHASTDQVERVARSVLAEPAYLSESKAGWISLYDAQTEKPDVGELHRVASTLSAGLGSTVWALLAQDSAALVYALYDKGSLVDEYCSKPEVQGSVTEARRARLSGQPDAIRPFLRPSASPGEVDHFFAGSGPEGVNQLYDQARQAIGSSPEALGQVLATAARSVGNMPGETLKAMLGKSGLPLDNPMMAPLLQNPAAFLEQLANNPLALGMITQQLQGLAAAAPEGGEVPIELRLIELSRLIGLDPEAASLSYSRIAAMGKTVASRFRMLEAH